MFQTFWYGGSGEAPGLIVLLAVIGLLLVVLVILGVLLKRLRGATKRADIHLRENLKLRRVFAEVVGWDETGRLPEDALKRLQDSVAKKEPSAELVDAQQTWQLGCAFARRLLDECGPPPPDTLGIGQANAQQHSILVDLLSDPETAEPELFQLLQAEAFDFLFSMALRLDRYASNTTARTAYVLASDVIRSALQRNNMVVLAPPPLTLVNTAKVEFGRHPTDEVSQNSVVRRAVDQMLPLLTPGTKTTKSVVIDCVKVGWRTFDGEVKKPVVQYVDSSW